METSGYVAWPLVSMELDGHQYALAGRVVCNPNVWTHNLENFVMAFLTILVCSWLWNWVKFPQLVCKISCSQTFNIWSQTHEQPENIMPSSAYKKGNEGICSTRHGHQPVGQLNHLCWLKAAYNCNSGHNSGVGMVSRRVARNTSIPLWRMHTL